MAAQRNLHRPLMRFSAAAELEIFPATPEVCGVSVAVGHECETFGILGLYLEPGPD